MDFIIKSNAKLMQTNLRALQIYQQVSHIAFWGMSKIIF